MCLKPRWHVPVQNLVKYPPGGKEENFQNQLHHSVILLSETNLWIPCSGVLVKTKQSEIQNWKTGKTDEAKL